MLTQLNPPLPLETAKGPGLAHFVIDYGPESHLLWVVFLDAGGACWTVPNPEIRLQGNWSMGRGGRPGPGLGEYDKPAKAAAGLRRDGPVPVLGDAAHPALR